MRRRGATLRDATYAPFTTGTATTRPTTRGAVGDDRVRELRPVHGARAEIGVVEHGADGEVAGGHDRVDLGAEAGGAAVERGEVAGHDRGGHHRDDQRGAPERERAGRASGHGRSFPRATGGSPRCEGEGAGEWGRD